MSIDFSTKTDQQIAVLIANHQRRRVFDTPNYKAAIAERAKRSPFSYERSREIIETAAQEGRYVAYGELAVASGVPWSTAYFLLGGHLWELVSWSHAQDLPMLSAIVVNKEGVEEGDMSDGAQKGFIRAAEDLGYVVGDAERFLEAQQDAVFTHYRGTPPRWSEATH